MEPQKRQSMSKKLRFDVFKRDSFKCQYCGSTPPTVILEVDHIHPVSQGGKNCLDNLLTACFDCNRGKGAHLLSAIPESVTDRAALLAEKMEQVKAFARLVKSRKKMEEGQIDEVEDAFRIHFTGFGFSPSFRESVRIFVQKLPAHDVSAYMHLACARVAGRRDDAIKYFCGICWKVIKERAGNGAR